MINDTAFERSMKTEEHFNIKFSYQYENGNWASRDSYNRLIANTVSAGDTSFDLVTGFIICCLPQLVKEYYLDLASLDSLNLDNPWWIGNQYKDLNINGSLYTLLGDTNLSVYKDCVVTYFNKAVLENLRLENLYTLVRENRWVMDKFLEMSAAAVMDLDGDGVIDPVKDAIGCYSWPTATRTLQTAMDITIIINDEKNSRKVTEMNDRLAKASEYIDLFWTRDDLFIDTTSAGLYPEVEEMLVADRALFLPSYLYETEQDLLRNMESDFGIVPNPKLDENQQDFKTQIGTSSNSNFLLTVCPDPELSCRVLEVLAFHSMQDLVPAYYTVALENKYTRDSDVPEILALIRQGMNMSFDFAYSANLSGTNTILLDAKGKIASLLESKTKSWSKELDKLIDNLSD